MISQDRIMALKTTFLSRFFGPKTKFHPGDQVQSSGGGPLMIVQWVRVNQDKKTITVNCKWFDSETQSTRTNLFTENQLVPFDWYRAR
jgi:uncharacterized protein YodC (DUF2158 family)